MNGHGHLPVESFRETVDGGLAWLLTRSPTGRYVMADVDEALEFAEEDILTLLEWGRCRQAIREASEEHPALAPLLDEWVVRHDSLWDAAAVFAEHHG